MGHRKFAICDKDAGYMKMLQAYLQKRALAGFEILSFDTVGKALEAGRKEAFEILLVGERIYDDEAAGIPAKKVFVLLEDGSAGITGCSMVAKYQSMERLIAEVLDESASDENMASMNRPGRGQARLVSFYAPDRSKGQSMAALAAAKILADRGERVLYIDLMPFGGIEEMSGTSFGSDVTDLLYFALDHPDKLLYKLESIKRPLYGIDLIPPALDHMDLLGVSGTDWERILDTLVRGSGCTYIVMDVSEACQGFYQILGRSRRIYTLADRSNAYSQAMLAHYKKLLEAKGYQEILANTAEFELPAGWERYCGRIEELASSPVGACMKGVLGDHEWTEPV